MGEVVEVCSGNRALPVCQRVIVPFVIACGKCFFCEKLQYAACDNSNPAEKADLSEIAYGQWIARLLQTSCLAKHPEISQDESRDRPIFRK